MKIVPIPRFIKGRPTARRFGFFVNPERERGSYLVVFGWKFPWIHIWKGKERSFSPPPPNHPNCKCLIYPVDQTGEEEK